MIERLRASLREAPTALPALAAIVLLLVWESSQAGYPLTHWAPGGLIVLALLAIAMLASPPRLATIPVAVKLSLGCLAAYTALSFCSILWAGVPGDAWEGADRTLLYLLLFALFALWGLRGASATLLLSVWTLATVALCAYVALRVASASGADLRGLFAEERLSYPTGYVNASAAQWLIAFWPALLLASGVGVPWALRGVLAGGAVLLADVALLSLSRGSVYATAAMVVLAFAFVPYRLRLFATGVPVMLGIAASTPLLLRVGNRLHSGLPAHGAAQGAVAAMLAAALLVGAAVATAGALESRRSLSPALVRGVRRAVGVAAAATLLAAIGAGFALAGDPVARAREAWRSFKHGSYPTTPAGSRLLSGLGSNRYDFYRVSLDELAAHPIVGIGADNFSELYLVHGRSGETPRYPHSVELRVLAQTGILGALLALVGLGAALVAGWRATRARHQPDALARTAAVAALGGFAYWVVHGSVDWFWEFAGLGGIAFALLGIACSLQPRRELAQSAPAVASEPGGTLAGTRRQAQPAGPRSRARLGFRVKRGRRAWRVALSLLAAIGALAAVYAFAAPWLSEREIEQAARIWPRAPLAAYASLEEAARLDRLSDRPYLVAGSIALRFGDLVRARRQFSLALARVPNDAYATLELGAIASASGRRGEALRLLRRAVALEPRDVLAHASLRVVARGEVLDVSALNRAIVTGARRFAI